MKQSPDVQSYLPLTEVEFEIMLTLAGQEVHGYAVMKDVEERTGGRISLRPGSLYRAMHRLEKRQLVDTVALEAGEDQRRRRYCLTELGRRVAQAEAQRMERALQSARLQLGLEFNLDSGKG